MYTLEVKRFFNEVYLPNRCFFVTWQAVEYYNQPNVQVLIEINETQDPSATPFPKFPSVEDAITYYETTKANELIGNLNANLGYTNWDSYNIEEVDPPVSALIANLDSTIAGLTTSLGNKVDKTTTVNTHALSTNVSVTKSDLGLGNVDNTSDSGKPISTATQAALDGKAATTHTHSSSDITNFSESVQDAIGSALSSEFNYNDGSNTINLRTRTFNFPTRSLNTSVQISSSQDALVSYSVDIACSLSISGGQAGTIYLRYADDSGHTTNVKEVCRFAASNTGTLTIGLALNQIATGTLSGVIPSGKYMKLVTENNTGTPTFTYKNAQEVLL